MLNEFYVLICLRLMRHFFFFKWDVGKGGGEEKRGMGGEHLVLVLNPKLSRSPSFSLFSLFSLVSLVSLFSLFSIVGKTLAFAEFIFFPAFLDIVSGFQYKRNPPSLKFKITYFHIQNLIYIYLYIYTKTTLSHTHTMTSLFSFIFSKWLFYHTLNWEQPYLVRWS